MSRVCGPDDPRVYLYYPTLTPVSGKLPEKEEAPQEIPKPVEEPPKVEATQEEKPVLNPAPKAKKPWRLLLLGLALVFLIPHLFGEDLALKNFDPDGAVDTVFGTALSKEKVISMEFLDSLAESNGQHVYDVSETGNEKVLLWKEDAGDGFYKVKIAGDGKVIFPEDCSYLFSGYSNLKTLYFGNAVDTQNVTTMFSMFDDCSSLVNLDLSSFDTQNLLSMSLMFWNCSSLVDLDLSSFDTQNVTNMRWMFYGCSSLVSLDLSSFDTQNVTDMNFMFYGCNSLVNLDLSSFDTQNVRAMDYMFADCSSLINLDLSSFDTQNVRAMDYMFADCSSLINLDLSGFNTQNDPYTDHMFRDCNPNLQVLTSDAQILAELSQ